MTSRRLCVRRSGSYETLSAGLCSGRSGGRCAEQIDADGEMIRTKEGMRTHPLLRDEMADRAFVVASGAAGLGFGAGARGWSGRRRRRDY